MDLEAFKQDLRENHRIKFNTDYSVIVKYDQVILTCAHAFFESILEVARAHGVRFTKAFMYDDRIWAAPQK